MNNYDDQLKSLDHSGDKYVPFEQDAGTIEALQSTIGEKQKLYNAAIADLAEANDCKYCANIDQCTPHQIERNFAYRGCIRWQWRGAKPADKAEVSSRKQ
jgi:hypothetical protein